MNVPLPIRSARRAGLSLIEVVVSLLLVGVVLVGSLNTLGGAIHTTRLANEHADARRLAEWLLDEVLAHPFGDPDGDADFAADLGESNSPSDRLDFDDLDDYHGWSSAPPVERDGTAIAGFTGWTRSVVVLWVDRNPDGDSELPVSGSDEGLKLVRVRVQDPDGGSLILQALRARDGLHASPAALPAAWIATVGAQVQTGSQAVVSQEASLTNRAVDPYSYP